MEGGKCVSPSRWGGCDRSVGPSVFLRRGIAASCGLRAVELRVGWSPRNRVQVPRGTTGFKHGATEAGRPPCLEAWAKGTSVVCGAEKKS